MAVGGKTRTWPRALGLAGLVALSAVGCATPARQTEALLGAPLEGPAEKRIPNVEFIAQTENYCGPATLAMAMARAGRRVPVEEIATQVYTPGKNGTLQQDLMGSARRQGMLAVQIQGLPSLRKEIDAGHPVIVFMNLGLSWYPIYHYALVTGYDLREPIVVMHSGQDANREWSMRKFERSWALGQYWGLVVLPPTELSAAADELEHAAAAAGLELTGHAEEAQTVYRKMLERWPSSFGALLGLGNVAYGKNDFSSSVRYLRRLVALHPQSATAWHNLATAQGAAKKSAAAKRSAARAMDLATPEERPVFRQSLRQWLHDDIPLPDPIRAEGRAKS